MFIAIETGCHCSAVAWAGYGPSGTTGTGGLTEDYCHRLTVAVTLQSTYSRRAAQVGKPPPVKDLGRTLSALRIGRGAEEVGDINAHFCAAYPMPGYVAPELAAFL